MAEGFEIEVPITIKGGKEGEKVGKQIGEKIAAQLQKTFRAVNIGGAKTGGDAGMAGMIGISKGLKGVAMKLGIVAAAIGVAVGVMAKASPYLKGILDIFGRAFMIFFRPFGDFLATLLRPLAILMMKMAVAFLKWTRTPEVKKATDIAAGIIDISGGFLGGFGDSLFGLSSGLDLMIEAMVEELKKFPPWLWEQIITIWEWTEDFAGWLWEKITGIWTWTYNFAGWLWSKITSIFGGGNGGRDRGEADTTAREIIGEDTKVPTAKVPTAKPPIADLKPSIIGVIGSVIRSSILKTPLVGMISSLFGGGQVGIANVPSDGLYNLHKGEEVVPKTKAGANKSMIYRPTFQISGGQISKDIDMDAVVRRAGRLTEMDLKQRGII